MSGVEQIKICYCIVCIIMCVVGDINFVLSATILYKCLPMYVLGIIS